MWIRTKMLRINNTILALIYGVTTVFLAICLFMNPYMTILPVSSNMCGVDAVFGCIPADQTEFDDVYLSYFPVKNSVIKDNKLCIQSVLVATNFTCTNRHEMPMSQVDFIIKQACNYPYQVETPHKCQEIGYADDIIFVRVTGLIMCILSLILCVYYTIQCSTVVENIQNKKLYTQL